ncbi:MAG: TIGR00282 family metallophosphoesterase [Candidatus Methylomirabilota bacterium]|nr:MAG: TIGR00282 family metallophosphoesterase [candidate division NC10 bacterium]
MRILFIGDVIGKPGREIVASMLPRLIDEQTVDLVIANGENLAGGFGVTRAVAEEMFALGIDLMTSGNHVWDKKEVEEYIAKEERLLRPANYPEPAPGRGSLVLDRGGCIVGVLNLQGRAFMPTLDCPFRAGDREIARLRRETALIFVDFHGEATAEKQAFAWYVDGRVSAVIGSHTHVQTADERILPGGTAFLTDVGMTGGFDSVIGMNVEAPIARFLSGLPKQFRPATGAPRLCGVVMEIDERDGRSIAIRRIQREP